MSSQQFHTVVFEITDPIKAKPFVDQLIEAFGELSEIAPGLRVIGVSLRDEISAVEELEANLYQIPLPFSILEA